MVWFPVKDQPAGRRGGGRRARTPLTGSFTARLTVNGKTYTQPFTVKPDPRVGEITLEDDSNDDNAY